MKTAVSRTVTSPKSKALWLINHTSLTFKQIANFCSIHELEVKSIADGVMLSSLHEKSPVLDNEVTLEQIAKSEKNPLIDLTINGYGLDETLSLRIKNKTYVSVAKRQNKPSAILWLKNNVHGITAKDIRSTTGATLQMIEAIISEKYRFMSEVSAKDPVSLGICTQMHLNTLIQKYKKV